MNKTYPLKVWITSLFIGSGFLLLLLLIEEGNGIQSGAFLMLFYLVFLGAFFSLPVLLLFYLACWKLASHHFSEYRTKLLLSLVPLCGMWLTFCLFMGKDVLSTKDTWGLAFPLCYSPGIVLSALVFKLREN